MMDVFQDLYIKDHIYLMDKVEVFNIYPMHDVVC